MEERPGEYPLRDEATEPFPAPPPVVAPPAEPVAPLPPRRRLVPGGNPWLWLVALILLLGGLGVAYAATRPAQNAAGPPPAAASPPPAPAPTPPATSPAPPPPPPPPPSTTPQPPPPPATVSVPSVVGSSLPRAISSLKQAGLTALVTHVVSDRPEGQVVGQNPAAGKTVGKGGQVRLNVSIQPPVSVPDLVGIQGLQAVHTLQADHLTATVHYVPSTLPARQVVSQFPPAGRKVKRGTSVLINVSQGNRPKSGPTGPTGATG